MIGSRIGTVRRGPPHPEPGFSVGSGERWLLVGEGLGELARRMLESSDAELVVVSPRIRDFESLRNYKLSTERDRLTFLCSRRTESIPHELQPFDGIAATDSGLEFQRFLRPGGRFVKLSS
jgi:hypothetical protein